MLICPCIVERSHKSSENNQATDMSPENQLGFDSQEDARNSKSKSKIGKVFLGITGTATVGIVLVTTPFVTPALRKICLPYVPATERQIANILRMGASKHKGSTLVDLGSGDGRVVIAAARRGYQAHGYELNHWLVWYSRLQARLQGLHHKATFSRADLWKMPKLQDKFQEEMKDDAQILACRFPLPNWKPTDKIEEGIDSVWLYQRPKP
ncbi:protein FAM173B-like isoform X2 [Stylophora pistillata]|uniref:protein FAM173B-like isoform X2 n=1 Tax=Stylophora pistillata TaxID=50429 RepID=UPI000C048D41|nr:protein FAM173B-like isoform X2 [Stylophora pistillata]